METTFIFAYGTLMTGLKNYKKYLTGKVLSTQKAYIKGSLYYLKGKDYPGFLEQGNGNVEGEILEIPRDLDLLMELDQLEECTNQNVNQNLYIKKDIEVFLLNDASYGKLPVYVYNPKALENQGVKMILLEHGSWRKYLSEIQRF